MRVMISNKITIEQPTEEIMKWCKQNLEIPNPDYAKKVRMNLWTGKTPPTLFLYEMVGGNLILPVGCLNYLPGLREAEKITGDFEPGVYEICYGLPMNLYDYQREAVSAMVKQHFGILQAPAGSGKTQMGISIIKRLKKRTLWITHTSDLLQQSKERAERYIPKDLIGTITEGKVNIGRGVTFATVQTLARLDLTYYKYAWDVIIVDECHRVSGTPTTMTMFSKVLNSLAARNKYGLSATVHRSDGLIRATYALLGGIIYTVPDEAVEGMILKVGVKVIPTDVSISMDCMNTDGTLNYAGLITYLTEDEGRNRTIVSEIVSNHGHPSLILSARVEHLKTLMDMLPPTMKFSSVFIDGKTPKAQREQAMEDMRTGRKHYMFATYSLAKEGLDIPRLDRLYMATPQKDYAVVVQSIGRIARSCEGKGQPICYDFIDKIPYLQKCYKERLRHYHKVGAYEVD